VLFEPLLPVAHGQLSTAFFAASRYGEAIAAAERAVELSPGNVSELTSLAFNYLADGQVESAERAVRRLPAGFVFRTVLEALIAARRRQRAVQADRVGLIRRQLGDLASYQYGEIAAQAGDADRAFAALDTAIRVGDPGLQQTMRDPFLGPLHKDARFAAVLKRLDFPIIDPT
jgi:tetratricopeptide (TPR) repeat protein